MCNNAEIKQKDIPVKRRGAIWTFSYKIKNINQLDPIEYSPPEKKILNELDVESEEINGIDNDLNDDKGQTELEF